MAPRREITPRSAWRPSVAAPHRRPTSAPSARARWCGPGGYRRSPRRAAPPRCAHRMRGHADSARRVASPRRRRCRARPPVLALESLDSRRVPSSPSSNARPVETLSVRRHPRRSSRSRSESPNPSSGVAVQRSSRMPSPYAIRRSTSNPGPQSIGRCSLTHARPQVMGRHSTAYPRATRTHRHSAQRTLRSTDVDAPDGRCPIVGIAVPGRPACAASLDACGSAAREWSPRFRTKAQRHGDCRKSDRRA